MAEREEAFLQRFFGAIEIARIAGLPRFANQRVTQSIKRFPIAGITLDQRLVIGDLIVGPAGLSESMIGT